MERKEKIALNTRHCTQQVHEWNRCRYAMLNKDSTRLHILESFASYISHCFSVAFFSLGAVIKNYS